MPKLIIIEVNKVQIILGSVLNELGRKEEAIIDYSKAIELNPKYTDAYINRGKTISKTFLGSV